MWGSTPLRHSTTYDTETFRIQQDVTEHNQDTLRYASVVFG